MEEVTSCPVEDGHEVVADNLYSKLGEVSDGFLVVFDVLVTGGETDLDVVVNVYRLNNVTVEAVSVELVHYDLDLILMPHLAGHLAVKRPNDTVNTGDLLNVRKLDTVVTLAVPTECHLHIFSPLEIISLFSWEP